MTHCRLPFPPFYSSQVSPQSPSCTSSLHLPLRTQTNKRERVGKASRSLSRQETHVYKKEEALTKWLGRQATMRSILRKGLLLECKDKDLVSGDLGEPQGLLGVEGGSRFYWK